MVGRGTQDFTIWLTERLRCTKLALLHEMFVTNKIESNMMRYLYSVQCVFVTVPALNPNIKMAPPKKDATCARDDGQGVRGGLVRREAGSVGGWLGRHPSRSQAAGPRCIGPIVVQCWHVASGSPCGTW